MHETADFKKGLKLMVEGSPYVILDFQHVKPGKGNQFSRTKMRNLLTGQLLETFKQIDPSRYEVEVVCKEPGPLTEELARQAAAGISVDGRAPRIATTVRDDRTLYRVVLGPYPTRADAERVGKASGRSYWVFEGAP